MSDQPLEESAAALIALLECVVERCEMVRPNDEEARGRLRAALYRFARALR